MRVGLCSSCSSVHAAGVDVNEEKDIERDRSAERPDLRCEEVAGPERLDMPLDEVMPRAS